MLRLSLTVALTACALITSARASADFLDVSAQPAPFAAVVQARLSGHEAAALAGEQATSGAFELGYYAAPDAGRVVWVPAGGAAGLGTAQSAGWNLADLADAAVGGRLGVLTLGALCLAAAAGLARRLRGLRTR